MVHYSLIAVTLFAGIAAHAAEPAADELKKLQGEWQVVGIDAKGKKLGADDAELKNMKFVIKDNELTVGAAGGGERKKTIKIDPTKTPKEIDMTSLDGQEKDTTAACIYKLEKDGLTICIPYFTVDPSKRPKEFKAGVDDGMMLITLKRATAN